MNIRYLSPNTSRLMPRRPSTPSAVRKVGKHAQHSLSQEDREKLMKRLQTITHLFDDAATVPGTKIKLGWDAVLGLIPIVGDASTTAVSAYFLWEAYRLGASRWTLIKMVWNVLVDFIIGFVPLVGDMLDVTFRANRRNMKLLEKELVKHSNQD
ncbi:DUF4112 domain-containing protein [Blastopirellula marina]|uniref:DUF4112 domain-containing protein n=1 Tax=Blastopirellula marina TaxID=124 RepID=A0A2S8FU55_9BACT|nr:MULTISPECIES: DUF4112 domain-containing protein [Pirellulaceae]PQO35716.1 DUF4112 domain-containing protein [Blastopirellula marina]RCS53290.1 DUF4112 domain-containing protein [Bremerella cremea]